MEPVSLDPGKRPAPEKLKAVGSMFILSVIPLREYVSFSSFFFALLPSPKSTQVPFKSRAIDIADALPAVNTLPPISLAPNASSAAFKEKLRLMTSSILDASTPRLSR